MENWSSCSINGISLKRLTLNGKIVWEKLEKLVDAYYTIIPIKFPLLDEDYDTLIPQVQALTLDKMIPLKNTNMPLDIDSAFTADLNGCLVIFTKTGKEPAIRKYDKNIKTWSTFLPLYEGIPGVELGTYDVEPTITIDNTTFKVYTDLDHGLNAGNTYIIVEK